MPLRSAVSTVWMKPTVVLGIFRLSAGSGTSRVASKCTSGDSMNSRPPSTLEVMAHEPCGLGSPPVTVISPGVSGPSLGPEGAAGGAGAAGAGSRASTEATAALPAERWRASTFATESADGPAGAETGSAGPGALAGAATSGAGAGSRCCSMALRPGPLSHGANPPGPERPRQPCRANFGAPWDLRRRAIGAQSGRPVEEERHDRHRRRARRPGAAVAVELRGRARARGRRGGRRAVPRGQLLARPRRLHLEPQ